MADKTRVSVTMTPPYIAALDTLVESGLYLNRGEAILEALRIFLRNEKIEPFCWPYVEALDTLVEGGLYSNRGEAILETLRVFLKNEKIEPFYKPPKAE